MPVESRRVRAGFVLLPTNPSVRENACKPSPLMRMVCNPGTVHFPHNGISLRHLPEPEKSVGDGEQRIVAHLGLDIFADEKRRRFPTGEKLREPLHERLHLQIFRAANRLTFHGAERIHHHDARTGRRDLPDDFLKDAVRAALPQHVSQIEKADGLAQLGFVEERKLLLVAQHFHGGFAENGKIERRFFWRRVGKNNLVSQRGLAATRRARDDVEGKFRNAAAQDFVEPAHSGRKFMDPDLGRFSRDFFRKARFGCAILFFHIVSYRKPNRPAEPSARHRATNARLNFRQ